MKLLVVDLQKALACDELYKHDSFIRNVFNLIKEARKNNIEVIYIQHDAGKGTGFSKGDEGFEIVGKVKPLNHEKVFVKTINSSFSNIEFTKYLAQSNDKELMIVGLQTEFCIDATIKSAVERGYKIYVPKGANSTFDNDYMPAKDTIEYYQKWIWDGTFAECISMKESIELLLNK